MTAASPLAQPMAPTPVAPPASLKSNPRLGDWLRLHADGHIEVLTGKVELGQGILHTLQLMAAEELRIAPHAVLVCAARTGDAPDEGMTAGSLSVQDSGLAIRHACAHARALLDALRAQQPDAGYAELAASFDGQQPVDTTLPLTPASQWQVMGRAHERADLRRLVQATADFFIQDLHPPGLLHGRVLRPRAVKALLDDDSWAQARPGCEALDGVVHLVRDGQMLGVIAQSERAAERAVAWLATRVRWSVVPHGLSPHDLPRQWQAQAAQTQVFHEAGEPPADTGETHSAEYFRPYLHHASIGTSCALAQWSHEAAHAEVAAETGEAPLLRVWSHSQGVYALRRDLALAFGLAPQRVEVQHVRGAGCYGHNGADDVAWDAAWLARHCDGRPLRLLWSRADEMAWSPLGPAMRVALRAQVGTDGRLLSWQHELWSPGHSLRPGRAETPALLGSWQTAEPFPALEPINMPAAVGAGAERNAIPPYRSEHTRVVSHRLLGLPLRTSSLRSLGAHANVFACESFIDEIAQARGLDPLAWRLQLLEDPRARAVLQTAAGRADWATRRSRWPTGEGRGIGLAVARYKGKGAYCAVVASVEVAEQVRVLSLTVVADLGQVVQPDGAALQLEGGALQSMSWALKEAARFDEVQITSQDWESYPILRFSEVPEIDVHLMPQPDLPSLGAGEATQGPTTAAIANAVFHALGVRVRELPLTPDAITRAINAAA